MSGAKKHRVYCEYLGARACVCVFENPVEAARLHQYLRTRYLRFGAGIVISQQFKTAGLEWRAMKNLLAEREDL